MTPADLSRTVVRAVRCAVEDGELPADAAVPARVVVERTRPGGVGEYATPVALQLAKSAALVPGRVADVLARRLAGEPGIERVEITGPGFLNFVMAPASVADLVRDVRERGARYGFVPAPDDAPDACPEPPELPELRAGVVRAAVQRVRDSQGQSDSQGLGLGAAPLPAAPLPVAPVARRDGDVRAAYGADAAAWAMLCVPPQETPVFPARLLVQDESSEFFRVRYAHARSRALSRNAADLAFRSEPGDFTDDGDDAAAPLLRALRDYPLVLEAAAHHRAPERLVRHLVELADALLDFQYRVLPKGDEKPSAAHRARLALAEAAGTVLAGGLALLGIDAPDCL
ncbi:ArgS-related anticodon-binding protein NrtL [Streptomyces sp. NPDC048340]|uniref:ArgS-related anticodon-binding protein NrtL n=1 Tax=Streptomyces sp. NPDC048340 TaxID=3365537 RepID=UPI0037182837